jgi:CSLREA domain-containing protein
LCGALALAGTLAAPRPAAAADHTFTVDTTADGVDDNPGNGVCHTAAGACTLRAAVMESNHTSSGTVEIVVPANANPYVLSILPTGMDDETSGDLNIDRVVTITGGGAQHTIIDGNGTDRVFNVLISVGVPGDVSFSGITVRNGSVTVGGGGLYIFNKYYPVFLERCAITGNAAGSGGGVYADTDTVLDRSTVSGNHATAGPGGGVLAYSITIADSTISGNTASSGGGGIFLGSTSTGTVFYSTIDENDGGSIGPNGGGGGIYTTSTDVQVIGSVLWGNVDEIPTVPIPTLEDCDCKGTFTGSPNLVGTKNHCSITATVGNPLLGPLHLNGGQVPTRALLAGSPAIGAGNPTSCAYDTPTDERGAHRPEGAACDLGAYEFDANGDANGDGMRDVADVFFLINYLFASGPAPVGLGDVNGDAKTDIADVFSLINFLFAGGPAPL